MALDPRTAQRMEKQGISFHPDFLDFPAAWAIQEKYHLSHDSACSSREALLCDCGAVRSKYNEIMRPDCVHDWVFKTTYDECRKCGLCKPI